MSQENEVMHGVSWREDAQKWRVGSTLHDDLLSAVAHRMTLVRHKRANRNKFRDRNPDARREREEKRQTYRDSRDD